MNKNSLFPIVLLAVLASSVSAAQSQPQSEPFALPTYVVETERYASAEQHINHSLAILRAQVATPVSVSVELSALKAQVAQSRKQTSDSRLAKS